MRLQQQTPVSARTEPQGAIHTTHCAHIGTQARSIAFTFASPHTASRFCSLLPLQQ